MHTHDDAFVVWAGHPPRDRPVGVETVAATALSLLGLDVSGNGRAAALGGARRLSPARLSDRAVTFEREPETLSSSRAPRQPD